VGSKRDYLAGLFMACVGISQLVGCRSSDPWAACTPNTEGRAFGQNYQGAGPLCFGYHSTCWSPWPTECPTCPAPTRLSPIEELGPESNPTNAPPVLAEPTPANPLPQPRNDSNGPPEKPPESPKSGDPKPAEPGKAPDNPVPNSIPNEEPVAPSRPLNTNPPSRPSDAEKVLPQNSSAEPPMSTSHSEAPSEIAVRRAQFYHSLFPQPVVIRTTEPIVLEAADETGSSNAEPAADTARRPERLRFR
jgi:hypothetical protein